MPCLDIAPPPVRTTGLQRSEPLQAARLRARIVHLARLGASFVAIMR